MGTSIAQEKLVHKQCPNDEIGKLVRYECDVPAVVRSNLLSGVYDRCGTKRVPAESLY